MKEKLTTSSLSSISTRPNATPGPPSSTPCCLWKGIDPSILLILVVTTPGTNHLMRHIVKYAVPDDKIDSRQPFLLLFSSDCPRKPQSVCVWSMRGLGLGCIYGGRILLLQQPEGAQGSPGDCHHPSNSAHHHPASLYRKWLATLNIWKTCQLFRSQDQRSPGKPIPLLPSL